MTSKSDSHDPFDPAALRTNVMGDIEVEKVLTTVPVRKPKRTEFFRVHPEFTLDTYLLERDTGMERETYLVTPDVQHLVASELRQQRLFTAITKHNTVFLWPVKLPTDETDRMRRTADSALQAAEQGKKLWTKMAWNRHLGAYEMYRAKGDLGDPQWPDKSFRDLIEIAFRNNLVDHEDHEVIRELSGEL
jgi:hypothetical protein